MAATIATAIGEDKGRSKSETRLGSVCATGKAATWQTFAECTVWADGSGYLQVKRGTQTIIINFGAETGELRPIVTGLDESWTAS